MKKTATKKRPTAAGILPNDECLIRNGYLGLVLAKKRKPQLFKHIKQAGPKLSSRGIVNVLTQLMAA